MGQMTTGVMLAVRPHKPPKKFTKDDGEGWYELVMTYPTGKDGLELDFERTEDGYELLGFWVALGSYGEKGAPALDKSFSLYGAAGMPGGFLGVPNYRKAHARAYRAWRKFVEWARREHGLEFEAPGLWLVRTEVA